jgi:hypothetical protein
MKRAIVERNIVGILFIAVLVAFSFAQRDTKKLDRLYTQVIKTGNQLHLTQSAPLPGSSN